MIHRTTDAEQRSNRVFLWISAAVLLCALSWLGHRLVFAQFQDYDDEGYLLVTVQQFLRGFPLYDQVYSQYGPAYYLWQQLLHAVIGIPLTHDATRVVTVGVWVICAVLVGAIVWLLTKRHVLTALGTIAAFMHLTQMTYEPGHPQELTMLCVLGALALTTWRLVEHKRVGVATATVVWVLVAIAALTKINVGAFLGAALTLALVTSLGRSRWNTILERVVIVATLAMVPALMRSYLLRGDIAAYVVVIWCGLLASFISQSGDASEKNVTLSELVTGLSAFAVCGVVIVAGIIYEGTSPRALWDTLFVAPQRLAGVTLYRLPVPAIVALAAPATVLAAWCWRRGVIRQRWIEFATLAWAVVIFALSVAKVYWALFAVAPLLAWLALSDRAVDGEQRAARRVLAFAAILLGLQAYPVPGTQVALGTVLYVPLALVMIADVQQTRSARERSLKAAPVSFGRRALLAVFGAAAAVNLGVQAQRLYAHGVPLDLPGARSVRTTERNVATYRWLTANIRENCDAFYSTPGLNSLHFWTEILPISPLNTTVWPLLFDDGQQRRILASAERAKRFCVAWHPAGVDPVPPPIAARPLMAWLLREFEPRGLFGDWEFRMQRGARATLVYEGRWMESGDVVLTLPSIGREAVARIEMVDVDEDRTLGDSARGEQIMILDENGAPVRGGVAIDVSKPSRITLRPPVAAASSSNTHSVVVRFWAGDGRSVAIVPIVSAPSPALSPHGSSTQAGPS